MPNRAAPLLIRRSCGVLALVAALAGLAQPVQPVAHVPESQLVKTLVAKARVDVEPRVHGGCLGCLGFEGWSDDVTEPVLEVLAQQWRARRHGACGCLAVQLDPAGVYLLAGLAVHILALATVVWC